MGNTWSCRLRPALARVLYDDTTNDCMDDEEVKEELCSRQVTCDADDEDAFVQRLRELYCLSRQGSCWWCDTQDSGPMSLVDLCVEDLCRNLMSYEEIPSGLPVELVDKILTSLARHKALCKTTLKALQHCEITNLSLSSCKNVSDDWLEPLQDINLRALDLSHCSQLTDQGLLNLKSLKSLQVAKFHGCLGLKEEAIAFLKCCPTLIHLDLTDCRNITDDSLKHLRYLKNLNVLILEGCKSLTDNALPYIGELRGLRKLVISQCEQFTDEGFATNLSMVRELRHLEAGFCFTNIKRTLEVIRTMHHLEYLDLSRSEIDDRGLCELGDLMDLQHMILSGCTLVSEQGLQQLPPSVTALDVSYCRSVKRVPVQKLRRLKEINLAHCGLKDADTPCLKELEQLAHLNLDSCSIGDMSLSNLNTLKNLTYLNLADTGISDLGMEALGTFPSLTSLSLFYCNVSDRGIKHLSNLKSLTALNLDNRDIGDVGMKHISCLTRLRTLDVFSARVSDVGLQEIAKLTGLTGLELCGGRLTDRGLSSLVNLTCLETLNLSQNCRITSQGLFHLASLQRLASLNISHCAVGGQGAIHALTRLKALETLAVYGCRGMTETVIVQIQSQLPGLKHIRGL